jgi:hypothetical protein
MARAQVRQRSPMMAARLARPLTGHPASDFILQSRDSAPYDMTEQAFSTGEGRSSDLGRAIWTAPPGARPPAPSPAERPATSHAGTERPDREASRKTRPTAAATMVQHTEQAALSRKLERMGCVAPLEREMEKISGGERGRFVTPADFPLQNCSPHAHVQYLVQVWDLSIVQGPFSVAPCQTLGLALRFATVSSLYDDGLSLIPSLLVSPQPLLTNQRPDGAHR